MKLHPPLLRDATDTSIQSRDLSDPHAYSMIFSPPTQPGATQQSQPGATQQSQPELNDDDDEVWPLRPRPTARAGHPRRRDQGDSTSRRSSSQNYSLPSHHHSSSVSSSVTRVASRTPSAEKLAELSDNSTPAASEERLSRKVADLSDDDSTPTTSQERLSRKLDIAGERNTHLQDVTALPTIPSKAGPVKTVFRAVRTWVQKLQQVPEQPYTTKAGDIEGEPIVVFTPGRGVYMAFACLANLTVMVALDSTALSVALPVIAEKLHGTALEAFWAAASYLLTSTVFQPTIAQLSEIFGRKWVTIIAAFLFLVGIFISGIANNFTVLLAGRSVQGIGGGGIVVLTQVIICDLIPLRLRGQWFGVISGMYAIGTVSGPLLGGVFSEKVTWRWIFWINVPFVFIALVMIPLFIRLGVKKSPLIEKLKKLDLIGSTLFVASATSFLIPLSWGGVMYPWDSWRTLFPLIVGAAGMVGVYFYEGHWAKNPMIHTAIFKNRNAAIAYIGVILHGCIVTGSLYYLPLYYEAVKGLTPILSGVALFPETFTIAPGAFIVGALIARFNAYRWAIWAGWAITCLGLGLLWLLDVGTSTPQWIFMNLVVGIGIGFNYVALGVMLQASTKDEHMTSAVSLFTFGRLLGQALGVVVGGVTFENELHNKLDANPALASIANQYANNGAALAQLIGSIPASSRKDTLRKTYADSLKAVWAVFAALAGVALLLSLFVKAKSLDREFDPSQNLAEESPRTAEAAPAPEGTEVDWQIPVGQEVGVSEKVRSSAAASRRGSKMQSRWYGEPGTVGSRPIRGARSSEPRSSSRYSREIGGFYSFPHSLTKPQVYSPVMGHRPTSILLPAVADQVPLEALLEDDFDRVMKASNRRSFL